MTEIFHMSQLCDGVGRGRMVQALEASLVVAGVGEGLNYEDRLKSGAQGAHARLCGLCKDRASG